MKIALIGPVYPYRGGIAHYTTMLYRALREQQHDVLLVSFKRQYPQWLFPGASDRDPSQQPLWAHNAQYWIDSLNPLTWIATFFRVYRYHPDRIILQWWTTFWTPVWFMLGILNRLFLRVPLVYICHNVLPHETHRLDPLIAYMALRWGDLFIVQSIDEAEKLHVLLPDSHVSVGPHPVYDMFADQKVSQDNAREQLDLPKTAYILLFFGIVREYKGLKDIFTALPIVQKSIKDVLVVVAGEFWDDKRPYQEMIEQLNLGDAVLLIDSYICNEEVGLYFSAADVLVAPYRHATGSGVVQIARGLGIPVITTSVCVKETNAAIHGKTTLVVAPEAPESLAEAILNFFRKDYQIDPEEFVSKDQFSWSELAQLIVSDNIVAKK